MSPRHAHAVEVRRPLLSLWEREEAFGAPVGCVATSFTFDAGFFEEELLGRFLGMDTDPAEDLRDYLVEREDRLSQVFACALVDVRKVAQQRSLRWYLAPMRVPGESTFHPKLSLLVWQRRVRVLVGSANLTSDGYRKNLEHMGALDFSPEGLLPRSLLGEVLAFLRALRDVCPSVAVDDGPFSKLEVFLDGVARLTEGWADPAWQRGKPRVEFVPVLPGQPSMLARIREAWGASRPGPSEAWILSPFFSEGAAARAVLDHLLGHMASRGTRTLHILARGTEEPDGAVVLEAPEALRAQLSGCQQHFYLVRGVDEENEPRALHAKSLWLQRGERTVYVIGSSNFTAPGLGIAAGELNARVNVEANLAYWPETPGFYRWCEASYPAHDEVAAARLALVQTPAEDSDELGEQPLHPAFRAAIFRRDGNAVALELHIDDGAPEGFVIREDAPEAAGCVLLDHAAWRARAEQPAVVPWPQAKPPSLLRVDWPRDREMCTAWWVVNVRSVEDLPEVEALAGLSLDDLLLVLASGLPLHEAVRRLKRRRKPGASAGHPAIALDPHKRVDTRSFLLRRMQRVANALEGLRERLARPVATLDALRSRMCGSLGPVALARRLAEEEDQAAGFLIAEVALILGRVDWAEVGRLVGVDAVQALVCQTREELRALADRHPASPSLASYVNEAFAREAS